MGSIFGSSQTTTSKTKTDMGPWKDQQPHLRGAFGEAANIYASQKNPTLPVNDIYANINGMQTQGANAAFANGMDISGTVPGMIGAGMSGVGAMPGFINGAGNFAGGNFNQGSSAANSAISGYTPMALGNTAAGLGAAQGIALGDTTGANIDAANRYAHNPVIDGQIDAALGDVRRNLGENTLPGLDAAAIASGNLNSSRAGVAEGIARRGAAETAANIAAGIRNDAYQRGLQLGETSRQANMQGALASGNAWGDFAGAGATAENNLNANRLANLGLQQSGLTMMGQGSQLGAGLLTSGAGLADAGSQLSTGAGAVYQGDAQNDINGQMSLWQARQDAPWTPLGRYMGIVGSANWGQNGTQNTQSTTTSSGNPLGGILGTALAGASLFGGGGPFAGAFGGLGSLFSPIKMGSK